MGQLFGAISFLGGLALAVFGVLIVACGWLASDQSRRFRKHGRPREARVVEVLEERGTSAPYKTSYCPVFEFTDETGALQRKPYAMYASGMKLEVGAARTVLDLPDEPSVVMKGHRGDQVFAILLLLGGAGCLVIGLTGMVY